jgi:hypothetical protein
MKKLVISLKVSPIYEKKTGVQINFMIDRLKDRRIKMLTNNYFGVII